MRFRFDFLSTADPPKTREDRAYINPWSAYRCGSGAIAYSIYIHHVPVAAELPVVVAVRGYSLVLY